jgi:hypothetical protein
VPGGGADAKEKRRNSPAQLSRRKPRQIADLGSIQ